MQTAETPTPPLAQRPLRRRAADAAIAALAARQHGIVAYRQLLAAGLRSWQIQRRVARGELTVIHRGVYRVGPLPMPRWREMAAVLICGGSAHIGFASAAGLLNISGGSRPRGDAERVDVVTTRYRRVPPWIRLHRVRRLPADETTLHDGIPVTTAARTLVDLATTGNAEELEHALDEALRRRLTDAARLGDVLRRYPRRKGAGTLRRLVAGLDNPQLARSEAERRIRTLVRQAELPVPLMNVNVAGYRVDLHWPDERLVVEVDGFAFHGSRDAFERDRRRDAEFISAGITTLRITWRQLVHRPFVVASRIGAALAVARTRTEPQR
jgi:very-short-patch-repair endonuclease